MPQRVLMLLVISARCLACLIPSNRILVCVLSNVRHQFFKEICPANHHCSPNKSVSAPVRGLSDYKKKTNNKKSILKNFRADL